MAVFTYIWEFIVRPGAEADFRRQYGPGGPWVRLFRSSPGYLETRLLRDPSRPGRFVTIDRWTSESAYRGFRAERAAEFETIDRACAALTLQERELGEFMEADEIDIMMPTG